MLEEFLNEIGHEVVASAATFPSAVILARESECDVAILDINLNGEPSYAIGDILRERDIPFMFATGYGAGDLPGRFAAVPVLTKPYQIGVLSKAIENSARAAGGPPAA
ncbi:response regulator [Rhodovastum atsumiense]|nr:response regulator [Rhodovastum atsumiense]